ncbi:uncharacterized protein [Apostichopus japonicus]|uniref:uncharacterized protein isoform X3 n=1 Tax=Stichopus japonicus TaxID=307972 RepID=UPI003AB73ED4
MYEEVLKTLSLPTKERRTDRLRLILPWLRRMSELMLALSEDTLLDIVKNCELRRYPSNYIIIKQGDVGDSFFVMMKGIIRVYVGYHGDDEIFQQQEQCTGDEYLAHFGTLVRTMQGSGHSFGELALIHKNSIRKASVITAAECDVLVINRDVYSRCLKTAQERDLNEKMAFIDSHYLFKSWDHRMRTSLAMSFKKSLHRFDSVIFKAGDPVRSLIFILRGSVLLSQRNSMKNSERRTKRPIMVDLSLQGPGGSLGDLEVLACRPCYILDAKAQSECELYTIDLRSFTKLFFKRNTETYKQMKLLVEQKLMSQRRRVGSQWMEDDFHQIVDSLRRHRPNPVDREQIEMMTAKLDLRNTFRGPLLDKSGQLKEDERKRKLRDKRRYELGFPQREETKTTQKIILSQPSDELSDRIRRFLSSPVGITEKLNSYRPPQANQGCSASVGRISTTFANDYHHRRGMTASAPVLKPSGRTMKHSSKSQASAYEFKQLREHLRKEERRFYINRFLYK